MAEPVLGAIEEAFRRIVREEVDAALAARDERIRTVGKVSTAAPSTPVESAPEETTTLLVRLGDVEWRDVQDFPLKSGSKTYTVAIGNPVKVKGLGRGGANGDGYTVTRIQRRGDDINVEVKKGIGHSRTVKSDKIIYKRPRKT